MEIQHGDIESTVLLDSQAMTNFKSLLSYCGTIELASQNVTDEGSMRENGRFWLYDGERKVTLKFTGGLLESGFLQ